MRRHFEFKNGQKKSLKYKKGDQEKLDDLTDSKIQIKYFPVVIDPDVRRPKYVNPLVHVYDTES